MQMGPWLRVADVWQHCLGFVQRWGRVGSWVAFRQGEREIDRGMHRTQDEGRLARQSETVELLLAVSSVPYSIERTRKREREN